MQFARALLGSLGASLSLVMAGTLALTSLSAVVAFQGLPGLDSEPVAAAPAAVLVAAQRDEPQAAEAIVVRAPAGAEPTLQELVERSARRVPRERTAARPARTASRPVTSAPDPVVQQPDAGVVSLPTSTSATTEADEPTPPAPADPAPARRPRQPVSDTTAALGDTVTQTGQALGGVVAPLLPTVSPVVEELTAALGDILTGTGQVLTGTVTGLAGVVTPQQQP